MLASAPRRQEARLPGTWPRASIQAQEAIHNASAFLPPAPASTIRPGAPHAADPAARRLDAATAALAAGRDLLHTHVSARPDGSRIDRSEWATSRHLGAGSPRPAARARALGPADRRATAPGSHCPARQPAAAPAPNDTS